MDIQKLKDQMEIFAKRKNALNLALGHLPMAITFRLCLKDIKFISREFGLSSANYGFESGGVHITSPSIFEDVLADREFALVDFRCPNDHDPDSSGAEVFSWLNNFKR